MRRSCRRVMVKQGVPSGRSVSARSISRWAVASAAPRRSQSSKSSSKANCSSLSRLRLARSPCEQRLAADRQAQCRGISEPLYLLRPRSSLGVVIGDVVDDDDPPTWSHDPSQLLGQATGKRHVMDGESGKCAVEACRREPGRCGIADRERRVGDPRVGGLPPRYIDHRRSQVDSMHGADQRRQAATDDARPACCLQPSLGWLRVGHGDQLVENLGGVCHRACVEALGLLGEGPAQDAGVSLLFHAWKVAGCPFRTSVVYIRSIIEH